LVEGVSSAPSAATLISKGAVLDTSIRRTKAKAGLERRSDM
jgi:hypothetical protein